MKYRRCRTLPAKTAELAVYGAFFGLQGFAKDITIRGMRQRLKLRWKCFTKSLSPDAAKMLECSQTASESQDFPTSCDRRTVCPFCYGKRLIIPAAERICSFISRRPLDRAMIFEDSQCVPRTEDFKKDLELALSQIRQTRHMLTAKKKNIPYVAVSSVVPMGDKIWTRCAGCLWHPFDDQSVPPLATCTWKKFTCRASPKYVFKAAASSWKYPVQMLLLTSSELQTFFAVTYKFRSLTSSNPALD